ncbi:hypothetical protein O181_004897 [Austropuccinia psidii MF-1]|uniref:Uncharacterized protein n=1 Tax=Austropuccinia psidii MF-1 TaxID=1389203 RepID=A0A9Q3BHR2_9BASI|nr:hypothetical protein [Austropuccinia psidii MF-1]
MPTLTHESTSTPPPNTLFHLPMLTLMQRLASSPPPSPILTVPQPHLIISAAYHSYASALAFNVLNLPSSHSCNNWIPHRALLSSLIDHYYTHGNICFCISSIRN